MTTDSILDTAKKVIYGDREKTYGNPGKNLTAIADFWTAYVFHKYNIGIAFDYNDVCAMMRLLKEARLINSPGHTDSLVDICGYAALEERVKEGK